MYKCTSCAFMRKTSIEVGIHVVHEHFPPEKAPFLCILCSAQKLSLKSVKKHKREKHLSTEMNVTMMFTRTKERVEFTSEHVYEVPKETNIVRKMLISLHMNLNSHKKLTRQMKYPNDSRKESLPQKLKNQGKLK